MLGCFIIVNIILPEPSECDLSCRFSRLAGCPSDRIDDRVVLGYHKIHVALFMSCKRLNIVFPLNQ